MRTQLQWLIVVATLMSSLLTSTAQTYRVDPDFAPAPATRPGNIDVIAVQPDGKLLVGGHFHRVNGVMRPHMARLQPDGSLDPTFSLGAGLAGVDRELEGDPSRYLRSIVIQPNGKIVIAGHFLDVNGTLQPGVARLFNDDQLDASFRPVLKGLGDASEPARFWAEVHKVFLRPEGKLIIAGIFSAVNGIARPGLAQLNHDGSLDESFRPEPALKDQIFLLRYLGLQPDGKLVAWRDLGAEHLRFNADGSRDSLFSVSGYILGITQEGMLSDDGVTFRRFSFDGKLDSSYHAPDLAKVFPRFLYRDDVRMLSDGSLLVSAALGENADRVNPKEYGLARLLPDGTVDRTLNQGQPIPWEFGVFSDPFRDLALLDSRGGIVISHFENKGSKVFRLASDGNRDPDFRLVVERIESIGTVDWLPDVPFSAPPGLVPPNWTLGPVLSAPGGGFWVQIFALEPFKQEVIRLDGTGAKELARFTLAGQSSLLAVQRDGKLLVAVHDQVGEPRGFARLNVDGSPDSTFAWGLGQQTPFSAVLLPDDKILVGGLRVDDPVVRDNYSGMARLHADGRLDQMLDLKVHGETVPVRRGERALYLHPVALQRDGSIIVQGNFTSIDGHVRLGLARLLPETLIRLGKPVLSGGRIHLSLDAALGRTVVLEAATSLSPPNWQPLSTHTLATGPLTVTDPDAVKFPQRLYRALGR